MRARRRVEVYFGKIAADTEVSGDEKDMLRKERDGNEFVRFREMRARFFGSTTQVGSSFGGGILIWLGDLAIMNLYAYKVRVGIELLFQYNVSLLKSQEIFEAFLNVFREISQERNALTE